MAIGDFNNDGALDILVAQNDGPPLLLKNNAARGNHWLGLRLVGKKSNPDAIGARITWQAGDLKRSRLKIAGGSYLSSHDPGRFWGWAFDLASIGSKSAGRSPARASMSLPTYHSTVTLLSSKAQV